MLDMFQALYRYNWWATQQILEGANAVSSLEFSRDLGGSFPSIQALLCHILWVELMFFNRWRGESTWELSAPPALETVEAIQTVWQQLDAERREYFARLTDAELHAPLEYQDSRGRNISILLWQAIFQCANHSTFHRGQIVSKFRQLGKTPPTTDFVLFCRAHNS